MEPTQITLNRHRLVGMLAGGGVVLVLCNTAIQIFAHLTGHDNLYGIVKLFSLDGEQCLPAFYSTLLILFAALLLGTIAVTKQKQSDRFLLHWVMLAAGFVFLAVDESCSIHELFDQALGHHGERLGSTSTGTDGSFLGSFRFPWVLPALFIVTVLGFVFSKFLLHLPSKTRILFLIAGFIYVGGAVGFEILGGRVADAAGENLRFSVLYSVVSTIEETLEMSGMLLFIWALLGYITLYANPILLVLEPGRSEEGGQEVPPMV